MRIDVKRLRLNDLIFNRQGSIGLRIVLFIFGVALSLFFRRIELVNVDKLPKASGIILSVIIRMR
jgi:hypothetical protein